MKTTTTPRVMFLHAKPYIFRTFKYLINSFHWGCKWILSSQQTVHKYTVSPVEEGNKKCLFSNFVSLCCPRHLIWCVIENQGSALSAQQTKGSLEYPCWVTMRLAAGEAGRLVMSHVLIATQCSRKAIAASLEAHALDMEVNIVYTGLVVAVGGDDGPLIIHCCLLLATRCQK